MITKHIAGINILLFARYYDPDDGRFVTQDTYRGENDDPQSLHLYAYTANNPINFIDPSGHKFQSLYSTLSKKQKNKLVNIQKKALKKVPSKKCHFERKKYNTNLPKTKDDAVNKGWFPHPGNAAHQFNKKNGKKYKKYFKGKKEVIYYSDGTLNNTHGDKDVLPWVVWGNSSKKYGYAKSDTTTVNERYSFVKIIYTTRMSTAHNAIKKLGLLGTVK